MIAGLLNKSEVDVENTTEFVIPGITNSVPLFHSDRSDFRLIEQACDFLPTADLNVSKGTGHLSERLNSMPLTLIVVVSCHEAL